MPYRIVNPYTCEFWSEEKDGVHAPIDFPTREAALAARREGIKEAFPELGDISTECRVTFIHP